MFTHMIPQLQKAAHTIKKSTTLILPEWFRILDRMAKSSKEKGKKPLGQCVMPHDVATHWNFIYEMLFFAYTYHIAYNKITSNCKTKMCAYELSNKEWKIVKDLLDVLKVCNNFFTAESHWLL